MAAELPQPVRDAQTYACVSSFSGPKPILISSTSQSGPPASLLEIPVTRRPTRAGETACVRTGHGCAIRALLADRLSIRHSVAMGPHRCERCRRCVSRCRACSGMTLVSCHTESRRESRIGSDEYADGAIVSPPTRCRTCECQEVRLRRYAASSRQPSREPVRSLELAGQEPA